MWKRDFKGRGDDGKFWKEMRGVRVNILHYIHYLKLPKTNFKKFFL